MGFRVVGPESQGFLQLLDGVSDVAFSPKCRAERVSRFRAFGVDLDCFPKLFDSRVELAVVEESRPDIVRALRLLAGTRSRRRVLTCQTVPDKYRRISRKGHGATDASESPHGMNCQASVPDYEG